MSDDLLRFALVVATVIIAAVPKLRHFLLFHKLEMSLYNRLGPLWEEGPKLRSLRFFPGDFTADLDAVEKKFGSQMTAEEWEWLRTSRQQHEISGRWFLLVFFTMVLISILTWT